MDTVHMIDDDEKDEDLENGTIVIPQSKSTEPLLVDDIGLMNGIDEATGGVSFSFNLY